MIGTDPAGNGGVASVASVLINEGFLRQRNITYISSHIDGSVPEKLGTFIKTLGIVCCHYLRCHPDVVHVHSSAHASFIRKSILLVMARLLGSKTIFHLHSGGFDSYVHEESGPLMRWWIRRTLEKSTKVIALSEVWADFLRQFAPKTDVFVLPNSVSLDVTPMPSQQEAARILFLGRSEVYKGTFELLEAIAMLKPKFPQIKLAIAGDGILDKVRERAGELGISDAVEILGWIRSGQKNGELQRASIFTLPSYAEGLPMSMLEAMSAGKAIVVTTVGGIPNVVVDHVNGLLIPPRDANALAAALETLLVDDNLRDSLGRNARKTIEENYSSEVVLKKLSDLYAELGVLPIANAICLN
jgi:glycosyltransferase involved in cell wall biosynthesis